MIANVLKGLMLGGLYLACGRNLAVPVIAHAFTDTLDLALIYLGKYPGMHWEFLGYGCGAPKH